MATSLNLTKEEVLLSGANGMVGSYCDFGIKYGHELDVTNLRAVLEIGRQRMPKVIVHLAALTDLALCEKDPAQAYLVNAAGTYNMALLAREVGAKLVYVSTSGVFDGTKQDPYTPEDIPNPINIYGHSKYLGELAVQSLSLIHI